MHSASYHFSWQKRAFDVLISLALIVTLFPVFCGIMLCILATSGYPVLFWQERLGHQKKPFKMLKFRTMQLDAEQAKAKLAKHNEAPWPMFKMRNDPRFTKFGWFLSRTGLDEIPQFFHVLTGKMSLIGPRPLPTKEANKLPSSWNFRYRVKPGILSEWAVAHDRYASLERWRALERKTIKSGSLKNDALLIIRAFSFLYKGNFLSFIHKPQVSLSGSLPRVSAQGTSITTRKRSSLATLSQ